MTNEEAIRNLQDIKNLYTWSSGADDALDMAIKSLKEQAEIIHCKDCANCNIDVIFGDCWCDGRKVSASHYCGYAERKDDETNNI